MTSFTYQEPRCLNQGIALYDQWKNSKKGNVVSILSSAMIVLRQLGPAGLDLWIATNDEERGFIRCVVGGKIKRDMEPVPITDTWSRIEDLMRCLRYAKYYAKTQKEGS